MQWGRVVAGTAASLAVAGCAVVVLGMAHAGERSTAASPASASATVADRPAVLPMSRGPLSTAPGTAPAASSAGTTSTNARTAPTSTAPHPAAGTSAGASTSHAAAPRPVVHSTPVQHVAPAGQRLPLGFSTGSATQIITVTATSTGSTTATLQAWTKVTGGWRRYGSAVTAHVGSDGLTTHASESRSATPIGSFTLTQAFGYYSDPGTALPYFKTTPSDYWISDAGTNYNTHQRCSSCGYNDGVNEQLYYETPYYNYAVVIDYNTRNAPGGVRQGAGSAFFLHVTDGRPTAGCVAIPQANLVNLMRWLTPGAHPRILIGVG